MIKAILIDDEIPALIELELLLKCYKEITVIGMFTNPLEAIEKIKEHKPQVVFLEVNMPQLMGIDAASKILDISPKTNIVFVTAFDNYAVDAFEIYALDYILKPVNINRLKKTIERLLKKETYVINYKEQKLKIKCLGHFEVAWENHEPIKWRAEKTKEIFTCLLQNQGHDLSKDKLLDMLWPGDNPDKAIRQLYNGIYYIRKALEDYKIDRELISIGNSYNLKLGLVDYDLGRFYELEKLPAPSIDELEEMEAIYTGDYLEKEDYSWAYYERITISKSYQQCLMKLAKKYIDSQQFNKAESKLEKAYLGNPYEETVTEHLLMLYSQTGEISKAARHFYSYMKIMKEDLGIGPSEKLIKLFKSLK